MIIGIGTDICEISRIERLLEKDKAATFFSKTLTAKEQERVAQIKRPAAHIAGRWAAKEALAKMLGTGFGEHCRWLEIEIVNNELGAPEVELSGVTQETAVKKGIRHLHLSISHERHYATAFAIGESS